LSGVIFREEIMRLGLFFGVILGALLTIGAAYTYDTFTGRAANTSMAGDERPMVNWDVVSKDFSDLRASLVEVGNRVQDGWKKLTS
jgi:hypothetical protein